MDFRRVLVLGLASAGALLAFGSSSCTIVDPQEVDFEAKPTTSAIGEDGSTSSGGEGGSTEGGGGDSSLEGGEASGPITAFSGAGAFNPNGSAMATSTKNASHPFTNMDPSGKACFDCHKSGGPGIQFAIGGSVFNAMTGGTPLLTGAEVRVVDATGNELYATYTDALGNFQQDPVTAIAAGAQVGVRNGTITKLMATKLTGPGDGNCNQTACHGAGGAAGGPVYLK